MATLAWPCLARENMPTASVGMAPSDFVNGLLSFNELKAMLEVTTPPASAATSRP